jgi:hypothetical protein
MLGPTTEADFIASEGEIENDAGSVIIGPNMLTGPPNVRFTWVLLGATAEFRPQGSSTLPRSIRAPARDGRTAALLAPS